MIRRVTLQYFKRFHEESFDLADVIVLAGPNNSGKSTLLQALAVTSNRCWMRSPKWPAHQASRKVPHDP